jgi:alkylhydroperoxidase family enzyme
LQGQDFAATAQAIRDGTPLDQLPVSRAEHLLLEFVGTIAGQAYRVTDAQVNGLRDVGWTDEQIAEAVYEAALFSLFVRLADAFDIHPQARYDSGGVPAVLNSPRGS